MKYASLDPTCQRCGAPRSIHMMPASGGRLLCDAALGGRFRLRTPRLGAASQSFSAEEIEWMDLVLKNLLQRRGPDLVLMRNPAAAKIMRKIQTMRAKIEARR